jgi:hypothetical protein
MDNMQGATGQEQEPSFEPALMMITLVNSQDIILKVPTCRWRKHWQLGQQEQGQEEEQQEGQKQEEEQEEEEEEEAKELISHYHIFPLSTYLGTHGGKAAYCAPRSMKGIGAGAGAGGSPTGGYIIMLSV